MRVQFGLFGYDAGTVRVFGCYRRRRFTVASRLLNDAGEDFNGFNNGLSGLDGTQTLLSREIPNTQRKTHGISQSYHNPRQEDIPNKHNPRCICKLSNKSIINGISCMTCPLRDASSVSMEGFQASWWVLTAGSRRRGRSRSGAE